MMVYLYMMGCSQIVLSIKIMQIMLFGSKTGWDSCHGQVCQQDLKSTVLSVTTGVKSSFKKNK